MRDVLTATALSRHLLESHQRQVLLTIYTASIWVNPIAVLNRGHDRTLRRCKPINFGRIFRPIDPSMYACEHLKGRNNKVSPISRRPEHAPGSRPCSAYPRCTERVWCGVVCCRDMPWGNGLRGRPKRKAKRLMPLLSCCRQKKQAATGGKSSIPPTGGRFPWQVAKLIQVALASGGESQNVARVFM